MQRAETMESFDITFNKARHERKFLIDELDKGEVEQYIKENPGMFSEIYNKRTVNSLYLDTADFGSYHDNVLGHERRVKIRVRWYGLAFGLIPNPVLEFKIKNSELGSKNSYALRSFILDKMFSAAALQEVFDSSRLPLWLRNHLKAVKPILMVSYIRRYFRSADKAYRLTIDHGLEYYRIHEEHNSFTEHASQHETVVVELKYNKNTDDGVEFITSSFPFRVTKNSKYVTGMDLLHF